MLVVYFCIAKGVKLSGKIAIYSSTAPFFLLIILLLRGLFLEGGLQGIYYLFIPDFSKLFNLQVLFAKTLIKPAFHILGLDRCHQLIPILNWSRSWS